MKLAATIFLCYLSHLANGQAYTFTLLTQPEKCVGGRVELLTEGIKDEDTLRVEWSTGARDVMVQSRLDSGQYWVEVTISSPGDSLPVVTDTTLYFTIAKETCPVGVPLHFSPNGDGYNDELQLSNIGRYPQFDLQIFNRWGQLVHRQRNSYTPWTGEWAGIKVPDGTYYYILFYDASDKKNLQKGDITILR